MPIGRKYLYSARQYSAFAKRQITVTCPGQGIIESGLLAPFKSLQSYFQESLDEVDEALNEEFSKNLFNTSNDFANKWLIRTSNAQPAILLTTYIINQLLHRCYGVNLAQDERVKYFMGHSLGEYTTLLLTKVLDLSVAVRLVRERGLLMEKVSKNDEYSMVLILFKPENFAKILSICREEGVLANVNSYLQLSLSGKSVRLQQVIDHINTSTRLILKSITLPVVIPFHNAVLDSVEPALRKYGRYAKKPLKPIVSNLNGEATTDPFENTLLANSRPVQWVDSMNYVLRKGTTDIVNLGPGLVLQGLNKKFRVNNHAVTNVAAMEHLKEIMSSKA